MKPSRILQYYFFSNCDRHTRKRVPGVVQGIREDHNSPNSRQLPGLSREQRRANRNRLDRFREILKALRIAIPQPMFALAPQSSAPAKCTSNRFTAETLARALPGTTQAIVFEQGGMDSIRIFLAATRPGPMKPVERFPTRCRKVV